MVHIRLQCESLWELLGNIDGMSRESAHAERHVRVQFTVCTHVRLQQNSASDLQENRVLRKFLAIQNAHPHNPSTDDVGKCFRATG